MASRLKVIVEYFKMALDCFFAVWFVVGNVWIFGGHSSSSEAPNLYRYYSFRYTEIRLQPEADIFQRLTHVYVILYVIGYV